ncbi:spore germination protein [Paenibacillus chitinolyticus]|uniref:spore germination protein n=1 Tax=Paenibacillus chitinolyticus TaxID=79263 RepID=UPI002DB68E1A|nr:spore germination protein [Paenibacillus chitinolyticus]MEC0246811.1 spore germination protein [Paenibacillus chitinolyticus]
MAFFLRGFPKLANRPPKRQPRQQPSPDTSDSGSPEPAGAAEEPAGASLAERTGWLKTLLAHCSDVVYHTFTAGKNTPCLLVYIEGSVDRNDLQQSVLKVILDDRFVQGEENLAGNLFDRKMLPADRQKTLLTMTDALQDILEGSAVLLLDGESRMMSFGLSSYIKRQVDEPNSETVIRGPREAFVESIQDNLSMLRKRLRTHSFKCAEQIIGTKTRTRVITAYLEDVCSPALVKEVVRRLADIEIDSVMGSSYLEEFIEDNPYSPFPQLQYTERPDVVAAALLEGRIAIIVEGTPIVVMAPTTLFMMMQSAEDYYQRFWAGSWIRWIRYVFLFVSLLLPSFYIAVTTFHPETIPERMLITIASSREVVPFSAFVEALIMEVFFEALREAATRIPKSVGQAVSIIGALIIGTAAVQAGIASAAMVIIVSLTGIASFIIPHYDLGLSFRLLRFPIMILAGGFGLVGIACAMILIYIHLTELKSFGIPYLSPVVPMVPKDMKDIFVRAPWWTMITRPKFTSSRNLDRQKPNGRKWANPAEEGD